MNKLKRLIIRPDGQPISFSTHLFFYISLMWGIAFILPPGAFDLFTSPLWNFTSGAGFPQIWGAGLIVVSLSNAAVLMTHWKFLDVFVGTLGFFLWFVAAFAYAWMGFWLGLFIAAIPNVLFWGWYSLQIAKFRWDDADEQLDRHREDMVR